jgi:hypothetical protein
MSTRTIIEINHDHLSRLLKADWGDLVLALSCCEFNPALNRGETPEWPKCKGVRILGQRHHSEPEWVQGSKP